MFQAFTQEEQTHRFTFDKKVSLFLGSDYQSLEND